MHARDLTRRVEPRAGAEPPPQDQQWLVRDFGKLEHGSLRQAMAFREDRQEVNGSEQPRLETVVARRHARNVDVAAGQARREFLAAVFDQMNFDAGVNLLVAREECSELVLDYLGGGANPEYSGLARLERACTILERFHFDEQAAAAPQDVFTFGRELGTAADAVEQRYTKVPFELLDLPRESRLAEMQVGRGAGKAAQVDDLGQRAKVTKIHRFTSGYRIIWPSINALDTSYPYA